MANKFTLKGDQVEIDYTIGANPSFPALTYKDGTTTKSFKPNEITTQSTALGSLVSIPLLKTVDTGGETFGFFLPDLDVPRGQTATFTTAGVDETFGGPNSIPRRPTTWRAYVLQGTAQTVIVPLDQAKAS
ncbi:MAG: hypothetical protein ABSG76_18580 [Xanthobacteraceae bacterium]|jgi:hypothetical protein